MRIVLVGLLLAAGAYAGVDVLDCKATDEQGNVAPIRLLQSGHASNQYAGKLHEFEILIHQLGPFIDETTVPVVSIRIERASVRMSLSTVGRAVSTPDGSRFVEGPKLAFGSKLISVECSK